jgi:hypothetical protein
MATTTEKLTTEQRIDRLERAHLELARHQHMMSSRMGSTWEQFKAIEADVAERDAK